ncbi:MAG: transglycosylase domain-containing protein, partial [Candidatus Dormibacteraceae bacterium]
MNRLPSPLARGGQQLRLSWGQIRRALMRFKGLIERGRRPELSDESGPRETPRLIAAFTRQLQMARDTALNPGKARVLRDRRGNRLRASAYGRTAGSARKGGDLGWGSRGWLPLGAKVGLIVLLAMSSFLGSSQLFVDYAAELPDAHALTTNPLPDDTQIYAADNSLLADLRDPNTGFQHYDQQLGQMGQWLPSATIAIEDANFWNEPGIDPQGIVRAELTNLHQGKISQGASTITQQLVKLRLLKDSSQKFDRKIKEAILALQVDRTYSKHQVLEMYLNSVEYGDFATGAQAAAQNYFRKDTANLDLAEASMLAGIPQNPNYNSPL